jgi:citrate synthase
MSTTLTEQFTKGLEGVIAGTTTICTINPENESLLYRGYPATELAESSTFEEVCFLLLEGRLPKKRELKRVSKLFVQERKIPKKLIKVLRYIPATSLFQY